jgi:hypothetical protein
LLIRCLRDSFFKLTYFLKNLGINTNGERRRAAIKLSPKSLPRLLVSAAIRAQIVV